MPWCAIIALLAVTKWRLAAIVRARQRQRRAVRAADQLDDDIDIVARRQFGGVVDPGEARQIDAAIARPVARRDRDDLDRAAGAALDDLAVDVEQLDDARAHRAQPRQRDPQCLAIKNPPVVQRGRAGTTGGSGQVHDPLRCGRGGPSPRGGEPAARPSLSPGGEAQRSAALHMAAVDRAAEQRAAARAEQRAERAAAEQRAGRAAADRADHGAGRAVAARQ